MPVIPIRPISIDGNIAYVPLTKGKIAVIDASDAPLVAAWNWFAYNRGALWYAMRGVRINGTQHTIWLHRTIMSAPKGVFVDHISGDGLDNRRENLRLVNQSDNMKNQRLRRNSKSGLKGASFYKGGWQSEITINGVRRYLGRFETAEEAHAAYCEASRKWHGLYGRTS